MVTTWFDGAAFDIFIADGGVDDFDLLTEDELRKIISRELPQFTESVLVSAKNLQGKL